MSNGCVIAMTGSTGFLGKAVYPLLRAGGYTVIRIGRGNSDILVDLEHAVPPWDYKQPPQVILHCAGVMDGESRSLFASARMAVNLLSHMTAGVKHLVLVSSAYVYSPSQEPTDETVSPNPIDAYGHSKLMIEQLFQGVAKSNGLSLTILRPCAIYGPGDPHQKAITRFIAEASLNRPPTLKGRVQFARDYIHVSDAARFVRASIDALSGSELEILNVCTGSAWSAIDLSNLISALKPGLLPPPPAVSTQEPIGFRFDPSRAARLLGIRADIDLMAGLSDLLASAAPMRCGA